MCKLPVMTSCTGRLYNVIQTIAFFRKIGLHDVLWTLFFGTLEYFGIYKYVVKRACFFFNNFILPILSVQYKNSLLIYRKFWYLYVTPISIKKKTSLWPHSVARDSLRPKYDEKMYVFGLFFLARYCRAEKLTLKRHVCVTTTNS